MTRVLVIEDDDNNMALISFILEHNGYQVEQAWTGREGIDRVAVSPPDFVILDIQLPDMDGEAVLRAIRAMETNGALPVVAMTSYAMAGDRERLLAAGCSGYIEKPIDPDRVAAQLREILDA